VSLNLRLACAEPGDQLAIFGEALRELSERATYLYEEAGRYWFSTQPTLNRLAEESRKDPGCVRFDVLQNPMRANHFTIIESWANAQALEAHAAAPHTRKYRDEVQPMTGSPLDERVFKAAE